MKTSLRGTREPSGLRLCFYASGRNFFVALFVRVTLELSNFNAERAGAKRLFTTFEKWRGKEENRLEF